MAIAKRGKGYCTRHKQVVPRGCACAECIIEGADVIRRYYRAKPYPQMTDPEVADRIIAVLNELLACDREAISTLVDQRVPCNAALVAHPTCQVGRVNGPDDWRVGLLGVLNAVAGARRDGRGYIAAEWAPDGTTFIQRFVIRPAVP